MTKRHTVSVELDVLHSLMWLAGAGILFGVWKLVDLINFIWTVIQWSAGKGGCL